MLTRTLSLGLINLLLLFDGVLSQSVPFNVDEISANIEATLKCHNNPGLAVSIVKDGKVLLSKGYGVTNLKTRKPVTDSTLLGIASISKSFAATLLVKLLYEKTNFTVDSQLREFLGQEFKMPDPERTSLTTFADLMGHRTAVPPNNRIRFDTNLTRTSLLQRLHLLPSPDQFRVKYYYSNLMYGLVTRLAELIGGKRWEELMVEYLFQPLGMTKSTFATTVDFSRDDVATGYLEKRGNFSSVSPEFSRRWAELAGSGSVMTTAEDMINWMNFHLYQGRDSKGRQVMQAEQLAEVHKPRFLVTQSPSKETRVPQFPVTSTEEIYAHGFRRGFYRGYERLSHSGSTVGYKALLSLVPQEKIGIFTALTGRDDKYAFRVPLHMYLMDRALGVESWLNVSTICSYPEPWKTKTQSQDVSLNDTAIFKYDHQLYQGTYHNTAYGYIDVTFNKTVSALVMSYGWGTWQLYPRPSENPDKLEKFYGEGLGITDLNLNPIYFLINSKTEYVAVTGIQATAFEPKVPPQFTKLGHELKSNTAAIRHYFFLPLLGGLTLAIIM